jgi:YfiH family protein
LKVNELETSSIEPVSSRQDVAIAVSAATHIGGVMAFSVRSGGRSPWPVDSLNFSVNRYDSYENVQQNFSMLGTHLEIDPTCIVTCHQTHGDTIAVVDSIPESPPQADAVVTTGPGIFPAIKTADCLSILILSPREKIAAAIHAGWRGTVLRITRKVLDFLVTEYQCEPSSLLVALGPVIGPCCYEVDDTVLIPFKESVPHAERFITSVPGKKSGKDSGTLSQRLDLAHANRFELLAVGVRNSNIFQVSLCTSCNPSLFFSFRRDGISAGRQLSVTGFRER